MTPLTQTGVSGYQYKEITNIDKVKTKNDFFSYIRYLNHALYQIDLTQLDDLNFDLWNDRDIETIVATCPNLESFTMGHSKWISNQAIVEIAKLQKLHTICFANNFVTDISPLGNLVNLKHLKIHGDLKILFDFKEDLETLSLSVSLQKMSSLEALTQLRELKLFGLCLTETPPLNHMVNLQKLELQVGAVELPTLILPRLVEFTLGCKDQKLPSFEGLSNLRKLSIHHSGEIDQGLLRSQLPKLEELIVSEAN